MPGDGAELICDGETLFVRGNDGGEELAGELLPEVIEEVLERTADAAVVVGRAEQKDIRAFDPGLERGVVLAGVGGVGIEERELFLGEVEEIDGGTGGGELGRSQADDGAGGGVLVSNFRRRRGCGAVDSTWNEARRERENEKL